MGSVAVARLLLAAAVTVVAACGSRSALPVGDPGVDAEAAPDGAVEADAVACTGTTVPLVPNLPNLYFVLDHSGSMAEQNKWQNVRTVIASLIFDLGASARFGVTVFPANNSCAPGVEVMPLAPGDPLGATQQAFLRATAPAPAGGTPTAATFRALLPKFRNSSAVTYVILATDGGPNCNMDPGSTACSVDQCTRNIDATTNCPSGGPRNCCTVNDAPGGCIDSQATSQAIADLYAIGIKTFVMGIPGSAPYAAALDDMATAGGTARTTGEPLYYRVDPTGSISHDVTALAGALGDIVAQTLKSCVLVLENTPGDPSKLNVYVNGQIVSQDGQDGWSLDGETVIIQGASCNAIQTDAGLPVVRVVSGCPTVH